MTDGRHRLAVLEEAAHERNRLGVRAELSGFMTPPGNISASNSSDV
jgi:hypothetical protein